MSYAGEYDTTQEVRDLRKTITARNEVISKLDEKVAGLEADLKARYTKEQVIEWLRFELHVISDRAAAHLMSLPGLAEKQIRAGQTWSNKKNGQRVMVMQCGTDLTLQVRFESGREGVMNPWALRHQYVFVKGEYEGNGRLDWDGHKGMWT